MGVGARRVVPYEGAVGVVQGQVQVVVGQGREAETDERGGE